MIRSILLKLKLLSDVVVAIDDLIRKDPELWTMTQDAFGRELVLRKRQVVLCHVFASDKLFRPYVSIFNRVKLRGRRLNWFDKILLIRAINWWENTNWLEQSDGGPNYYVNPTEDRQVVS